MLASLIHKPPQRLILHEPGLAYEDVALDSINEQLRDLCGKNFDSKAKALKWVSSHFPYWGVKEVRQNHIVAAVRRYRTKKILITVRDMRHVAISYRERIIKVYGAKVDMNVRLTEVLIPFSEFLVRLARRPEARVCRYEDFVSDAVYRQDLSRWLRSPLDGDLRSGFDRKFWQARHNRDEEYKLHGGRITTRSLHLRNQEQNRAQRKYGDLAVKLATIYQERFGYGNPRKSSGAT